MESVYQYHCCEDDQNDLPNNTTQLPCHCFLIRLYFYHVLGLEYPQRNLVPLTSFNQSTLVPCNAFFVVGPTILANLFSNTGVSQDFLDTATPSILSFASVMFNDARNIGRVLFPIAVFVLVVTPYDERDQIDRAIRESMEARTVKTVPAAKSSIDGLKKVRIDDFCSIRECSICLEEFCDGLEVVCLPCLHLYHKDCIVKWLHTSHLCPLCRFPMPTWLISCNIEICFYIDMHWMFHISLT